MRNKVHTVRYVAVIKHRKEQKKWRERQKDRPFARRESKTSDTRNTMIDISVGKSEMFQFLIDTHLSENFWSF